MRFLSFFWYSFLHWISHLLIPLDDVSSCIISSNFLLSLYFNLSEKKRRYKENWFLWSIGQPRPATTPFNLLNLCSGNYHSATKWCRIDRYFCVAKQCNTILSTQHRFQRHFQCFQSYILPLYANDDPFLFYFIIV